MICYAFIGIQGSGKGTQAARLSSQLDFQHINIGDLFRARIEDKSPAGRQIQEIIQRGELVQDDIVFSLIEDNIDRNRPGIVFDGFPRTIHQGDYLVRHFNLKRVFYLEIDEPTAMQRITSRRVCSSCQENYNIITKPPRVEGICDKCNGRLIVRHDDSSKALHTRFMAFSRQTKPLKQYFEKLGILSLINATLTVQDIYTQILAEINRA